MVADTLLVRCRPGEVRLARVNHKGALIDFALYRTQSQRNQAQAGDVFLGRVKKVVPALEAAFVDIGAEREGFLGLTDARPHQHTSSTVRDRIADYVHEGESVLVQVTAEARADKGAKLTRRPSVTGALLVLTPGDPGVRVSKRVTDDAMRAKMRAAITGKLPGDVGCVVRSAARDASEAALKGELALLTARWTEILDRARACTAPARLSAEDLIPVQYLTETGLAGLGRIEIDDAELARATQAELEKLGALPPGKVERPAGREDIFKVHAIADEIDALMSPVVPLKSGGTLIIEETAALTVIDVNAGGGRGADAAMTTNLEAVKEAARQMRLRNLSGLIVMDLMAVRGEGAYGRIVNALKDAVAHDPAGPFILGTTKAGLLEITRPRKRAPLSHALSGPCPVCASNRAESPLATGLRALERVLEEVWAQPALVPTLRVSGDVISALKTQAPDALGEVARKLGHDLDFIEDNARPKGTFAIEQARD